METLPKGLLNLVERDQDKMRGALNSLRDSAKPVRVEISRTESILERFRHAFRRRQDGAPTASSTLRKIEAIVIRPASPSGDGQE